jgi:hypothetical protein
VIQRISVSTRKSRLKLADEGDEVLIWNEDDDPRQSYAALGAKLAQYGDLFRAPGDGGGLLAVAADGRQLTVETGKDLLPIIVDRQPVQVVGNGKSKGRRIGNTDLNAMLKTESFLAHFRTVDRVSKQPVHLDDWSLAQPGYNDGAAGFRIFFTGAAVEPSSSLDTINTFLDVMPFETEADRTNTVAAALTVLLRDHWPGGKPIVLVTANKSHAGKDTIIDFAAGMANKVSISYQQPDWALEHNFVIALKTSPDAGVIVIENARLVGSNRVIASAFIERFATDPEPLLSAPGTGEAFRLRNNLVLAISTNFGTVSEDILNRSLSIRLDLKGDIASRESSIGNPRHEFLPMNRTRIMNELFGMIERWIQAGMPLDDDVRHPFSVWAGTIGGILKVNGFNHFLENYGTRRTLDDPIKRALAILGTGRPNEWLRPSEWSKVMADLGLTKTLIVDSSQRENDKSLARALSARARIGV